MDSNVLNYIGFYRPMEWVSLEDSMFTEWATTQYIFCNRLKYCLPLCRVIIISQISLVIGYFCKARVRAVFQNDFLFSLDKMFQLKCIWRDIEDVIVSGNWIGYNFKTFLCLLRYYIYIYWIYFSGENWSISAWKKLESYTLTFHLEEGDSDLQTSHCLVGYPWLEIY